MSKDQDPLKRHEQRLSDLVTRLLDLGEETDGKAGKDQATIPQLINLAKAVSSILIILIKIREAAAHNEHDQPGSAVARYAGAFKSADATRRRAADTRRSELDAAIGDFAGDDSEGDDAH
jgi:hypothetical protein